MVSTEDLYNKLNELEKLIREEKGTKESNDLLDVQDVCLMLKVSQRTVHNYSSKGLLKKKFIGGKLYFSKREIEEAMN